MFKIGDFSKLTRVSAKTLHHYDAIGLFKPGYVDGATGYRYYSFEQLPRLNRILVLKNLGFTLEHIAAMLDDGLSAEALEGMLRLKQAELAQQIDETRARLKNVAARLKQIKEEGNMPVNEVALKSVEAVTVASAREVVLSPQRMRERCLTLLEEVFRVIKEQSIRATGTTLAIYHHNGDDHNHGDNKGSGEEDCGEEGIDVEMAVFLDAGVPSARYGHVSVRQLAAEQMACVVYKGNFNAFEAVGQVHVDIGRWIEANGYEMSGSSREIYWQPPVDYRQEGVMEIQYPVGKA